MEQAILAEWRDAQGARVEGWATVLTDAPTLARDANGAIMLNDDLVSGALSREEEDR